MASETRMRETDVVVIGAGPGGYAAAFAAADKGLKVIIVDADEQPGGVCLNRGCIPSKALLHVARLINESREAAEWGVKFNPPAIDIDALRRFKNEVVGKNAAGVRQLARLRKVEILRAWARFENSRTLLLSSRRGGEPDLGRVNFQRAVLASGSRPTVIPALKIDSQRVWDSTTALELPEVPRSLLIVGGGYIGLEMGTIYAALGSEVTVVEMTDGLLPGADRDLVRVLEPRIEAACKNIYLQSKVVKLTDTGRAVEVTFEPAAEKLKNPPPKTHQFDRVLFSIGRTPNSEGLGLENTKVKVGQRGFVEVDTRLRTADEHIYAIGDVVGEPMLAHKASYEAKVVAEVLAGGKAVLDARAIPAVVFTDPEIAWTGLTETQAKKAGRNIKVAKFSWGASGRATAMGRNDGLTKVIADPKSHRVLGVGIVGVGAGELIAEATLAIEMGASASDLGLTIHPHPTLSETLAEAAESAFGTTIHQAPAKR
ncbi:MAG TPA: dihydrolipoyl dehydrogenase [Phycisphaerae bacterium]|nr:dihydrolipoyl dehydrogenase [Phycisphaerae bacterium]